MVLMVSSCCPHVVVVFLKRLRAEAKISRVLYRRLQKLKVEAVLTVD